MTVITSIDRLTDSEVEMRRDLVVTTARTTAIITAAVGILFAALWILSPSPWEAFAVLCMVVVVGASFASMNLGQSNRTLLSARLLVTALMVVIAVASLVLGGRVSLSVASVVPVVLAGLLLQRRSVLWTAGAAVALFVMQAASADLGWALLPLDIAGGRIVDRVIGLGIIVMMAQLALEYIRRLGTTLTQLEARAMDAEQRAAELEIAKAEIERRVNELADAKREIESKTQVSTVVASEIQGMAQELATTSNEQASGSTEQAAAMGEIVATMEELSRAASQIASNSASVSQQVSSALQAAQTGRQAVEETIAGLDRIRTEVRSVAEKNLTLGQKTQAIGEIIEVISEIADRTHLLALNAAIESAAAGEYGRRFSVVASQVKELATEAKSAAHQVRTAVGEIQRAASATVLAAEKSEADVEVGASLGRGAGEAIGQIVETVQEVAGAAKEMLLATQQQQSASEQVVSTIRQIEQVTRQSAEGSRQVSQTVSQLISAAERLQ